MITGIRYIIDLAILYKSDLKFYSACVGIILAILLFIGWRATDSGNHKYRVTYYSYRTDSYDFTDSIIYYPNRI